MYTQFDPEKQQEAMDAQKQQMAQAPSASAPLVPTQPDSQAQNGTSLMQKEGILPDTERQDFLSISPANQQSSVLGQTTTPELSTTGPQQVVQQMTVQQQMPNQEAAAPPMNGAAIQGK